MSASDARSRLAEQQADLVRALVGGGEPPAGFDAERLRLAARSLVNKRLREVERAWPALARCLGERWPEQFTAFARITPPPAEGGPLADGLAFARTLPQGDLDDEARAERFFAQLHRARLPLRMVWLPRTGRLVLGVRLPWLAVRMLGLRLPLAGERGTSVS
jgi:hypothetical protein